MGSVDNGAYFHLDLVPFPGAGKPIVHDHVKLLCAVFHIIACLKFLDCGGGFPVRKVEHRTHTCIGTLTKLNGKRDIRRLHTDRAALLPYRLRNRCTHLIGGHRRIQRRRIDISAEFHVRSFHFAAIISLRDTSFKIGMPRSSAFCSLLPAASPATR